MTAIERLRGLRRRWQDGSLTVLLAVQLLAIFGFVPAVASGLPFAPGLAAFLLLVFMSVTVAMARGRWALGTGASLLMFAVMTAVLQGRFQDWHVRIAGQVTGLVTFLLLGLVVLRAVFRPGQFTGHRIRGAVVFYLNLGLLFAFVHRLIAEAIPGSYEHLPPASQAAAFRAALDYFSFSTLTSVGYGDIVPVSPIARAFCTLEAASGQLLPTILIARVVTLTMQQSDAEAKGIDQR